MWEIGISQLTLEPLYAGAKGDSMESKSLQWIRKEKRICSGMNALARITYCSKYGDIYYGIVWNSRGKHFMAW